MTANITETYREWRGFAEGSGTAIVPSVLPGFDNTGSNRTTPSTKRCITGSLDESKGFCEEAKELADPGIRMVMVTSFNEWHEGTAVEPSVEDGYAYLGVIREVFTEDGTRGQFSFSTHTRYLPVIFHYLLSYSGPVEPRLRGLPSPPTHQPPPPTILKHLRHRLREYVLIQVP